MRSDAELLKAYAGARDEAAFAELVARHGAMVYRTCLRVLGNGHDAEEASQATFVVLVRKAGGLSGGGDLAAWLHSVARNVALRSRRGRFRRSRSEEDAAMERRTQAAVPEPDSGLPALGEDLDRELAALSAGQRQAVVLRYLEGRSEKEAAEAAGVPVGTLSRRASDGLERLRTRLCGRGQVLGSAALVGLLGAEAAAAVPATLLPSILAVSKLAAAGAAAGAAGSTAIALAEGAMKAMFWIKMKIAAAAVVAAMAVSTAVPLTYHAVAAGEAAKPALDGKGWSESYPVGIRGQWPEPGEAKGGEAQVTDKGIDTKVVWIRGGNVFLSAGTDQGVKLGYEFVLTRQAGQVGEVVVKQLTPDMAMCRAKSLTLAPQVGDTARTRFGTVLAQPGEKPVAPAETGKIAWGAAVDGLQAGLVPLGGGAAADWGRDWLCAKCFKTVMEIQAARGPADGPGRPPAECSLCGQKKAWVISTFGNAPVSFTHKVCPSCAVAKRVCQGCGAAKPSGATFAEGKPLLFEIHGRNTGKEELQIYDFAAGNWVFVPVGGGQPIMPRCTVTPKRQPVLLTIRPGEVMAGLAEVGGALWIPPLPPGKYTVTASYEHAQHEQAKTCPYWHGKVTTGAMEIEIVGAREAEAALVRSGARMALELAKIGEEQIAAYRKWAQAHPEGGWQPARLGGLDKILGKHLEKAAPAGTAVEGTCILLSLGKGGPQVLIASDGGRPVAAAVGPDKVPLAGDELAAVTCQRGELRGNGPGTPVFCFVVALKGPDGRADGSLRFFLRAPATR